MAGIIKNQILKHLSRFVKNLSSDRINLSTLKGEGELNNLELEEDVLTELLALPTWMKLTRATVNRVGIRIPWTKLKSVPIHLSLDEVFINVEACEELRQQGSANPSIPLSFGKYGFVQKVIDGITATVNSVEITFSSKEFESKVQISRIRVESRSPEWNRVELSGTRLKDMNKGETLIFKEMEWQTLRLESRSTSDRHLAPLRLLTNQAKARIVIKKKLSDCQVVGVRLSLILDDLLWVLTDSQILAALHFISSLSSLVKQATELTQRVKAARKLESLPEYQAQLSQTHAMQRDGREDLMIKKFDAHDVRETSYHFICEKIDLHFCDDPGNGRSQHPDLKDGGALQLSLSQVMVDFYPYHLARGTRKYWSKYSDNTLSQWLNQSIQGFRISLIETLSSNSMHSPLHRTQNQGQQAPSPGAIPETNPVRERVTEQLAKLMSTCTIFKVQDLRLFRVTTSSKREAPQPFISTFIERPKDLPVIHAEFSSFYYPGDICFPLPSPKIYAHLHPIQIHMDFCTVLWLNSFIANLQFAMEDVNPKTEPDYVDVRVELIMPKLVFENKTSYPSHKDRPQSLHLQVSRMVLSNFRSTDTGTLHQLTQCLELLQRGDLVYGTDFPAKASDTQLVSEKFLLHAEGRDKIREVKEVKCSSFKEMTEHLTKDMLWTEPRDVWYISLDPFWAEFHVELKRKRFPSESVPTSSKKQGFSRNNTVQDNSKAIVYPFIDSIPITVWIYVNEEANPKEKQKQKNIHALFSANGMGKAQLTHNEFLFVMRMAESLNELSLYVTLDLEQIMGKRALGDLVTLIGILATVEVSLLYPPPLTGKQESPSMDLDSINPDSSSRETELENPEIQRGDNTGLPSCMTGSSSAMAVSISTPQLTSAPISMSSSPLTMNAGGGSNPILSETMRNNLIQSGKSFPGLTAATFSKCGGTSTPDSEVVSNWSNFSSEDSSENNFVQLDVVDPEISTMGDGLSLMNIKENGDFGDEDGVEVATEVVEENDLTERSTPSPIYSHENALLKAEKDDSVGVFTIKLEGVEVAQEGKGLHSVIKFQCRSLGVKECTGMGWNEFQTKFGTRYRTWAEEIQNPTLTSPTQRRAVKVRLAQKVDCEMFKAAMNSEELQQTLKTIRTPSHPRVNLTDRPGTESPIRKLANDATTIFLDGRADLRNEDPIVLHMSTVMELSAFFEDEIIPSPFPMQIEVIGLNLELIEDRPSPNISSPGPVPLNISIPDVLPITRDKYGVFLIGHRGYKTPQVERPMSQVIEDTSLQNHDEKNDAAILQVDLEKVLRQLDTTQKRNLKLEEELESSQDLKIMVLQLQEQVSKLQEEKSSLLTQLKRFKY